MRAELVRPGHIASRSGFGVLFDYRKGIPEKL